MVIENTVYAALMLSEAMRQIERDKGKESIMQTIDLAQAGINALEAELVEFYTNYKYVENS